MKTAVIVLLAFVAMASAQGVDIVEHNPEQVQIGQPGRRFTNIYNPYKNPSQVHIVNHDPTKVQIVEHNPVEKVNVVNPFPDGHVIDNVDPGFYMPHNPSPPHGGYQQPNADPEYVRNPDGSLYYPDQHQQPYPYHDPMARGGN